MLLMQSQNCQTTMSIEVKQVCFILEAGGDIGWGHLNRCIALALKINNLAATKVSFLIVTQEIINIDFKTIRFKNLNELFNKISTIKNTKVIIDSYNITIETINQLNNYNNDIYIIDDLLSDQPNGVSIINPSLTNNYDKYSLTHDRVISGSRYVLLREGIKRSPNAHMNESNIFIYLGGATGFLEIDRLIRLIIRFFPKLEIDCVVNNNITGQEKSELESLNNKVNIYSDLTSENISNLIESCVFGIIAAGQIIYEFMLLHRAFIAIYTASNQKNNIDSLKTLQNSLIIIELDQIEKNIIEGIYSMMRFDFRKKIIDSFVGLVDEKGSQRVAEFIMGNNND